MAVTVENGRYVVELPEHGVKQAINTTTGLPFATQAEAQAWETSFLADMAAAAAAAQAAAAAAEQTRKQNSVRLVLTAPQTVVAVNTPVVITATLKNGLDQVVPLTREFHTPVENNFGVDVKIKRVVMTNGVATVNMNFDKSGFYRLTEKGINSRLEPGLFIALPTPFEIMVYE